MTQTAIERYLRWFEYEKNSHAKTLASLNATPDGPRESEGFRKAVYLMGHIIAARRYVPLAVEVLASVVGSNRPNNTLTPTPGQLQPLVRSGSL